MERQVELFDLGKPTIGQQFRRFHAEHPEVYEELVSLSRIAKMAGRQAGIKMVFEVLRWNRMIAGLPDPGEDYKLNNNYHSRYARLIMRQEPDLKGFFETRRLRS